MRSGERSRGQLRIWDMSVLDLYTGDPTSVVVASVTL